MYLKLVLLCVLVLNFELVYCEYPSTPCPSPGIFSFEDDGPKVYGKIVLQSTVPVQPVSTLEVRVNFTIAAPLYGNYTGHIEPETRNGYALVQKYNRGEPVEYRVNFPTASPLPKLTELTVNNNTLCNGPGDTLTPKSYVTMLSLRYYSYLQLLPQPHGHWPELLPPNLQRDNPITLGDFFTPKNDIPQQLPWLAALYRKKKDNLKFVCGGTLISNRHVITVAQCLQSHPKSKQTYIKDIVVRMGVHNSNSSIEENTVNRTLISGTVHKEFKAVPLENDIGLITLNKPVEFNQFIRPACLWNGNTDQSQIVGSTGVVAGWGEHGPRGAEPNIVRIPIVSTTTCRASNPIFLKITSETTFCAGSRDDSGPCIGDSGGGLYLIEGGKWKLRGMVSLSLQAMNEDSSCNLSEYIVFTDVAQYLPWIKSVTSEKH